jgi:basic membrane protein A
VDDAPPNLWVIGRNFHTGFYALGALAARSTKTGKIGYIGGLTLPFSYSEVHAAEQAISDLGLDVTIEPVWVGDFSDPTKASQLADAMIANGVDVIMGSLNLGMFGIFEAVKSQTGDKVLVTAKYTDKAGFAPDNYLTAILYDFKAPLTGIINRIQAGETGGFLEMGFENGVSLQLPLHNSTPEVESEIETILSDIQSGNITVIQDTTPIE